MKKSNKKPTKKTNLKAIIAAAIVVVILIVAVILLLGVGETEPAPVETVEETKDWANKRIQQDHGTEDFVTIDKPVIFNFGKGNYDITEMVKGQSFGQPTVSLKEMATFMGLEADNSVPTSYRGTVKVEYYDDAEQVDISNQRSVYLFYEDEIFHYLSESGMVEDNHRNQYNHIAKAKSSGEDDMLVTLEYLPVFVEGKPEITNSLMIEEKPDAVVYTLMPADKTPVEDATDNEKK